MAAPWRWATRSAPPARSSPSRRSMSCTAPRPATRWSPCASAAARGAPRFSNAHNLVQQTNKVRTMTPHKIVEAYFQAVNEGRFADAAGYFAPDLRLWLVGEGSWKLGGLHDRDFMLGIQKLMLDRFPKGVQVALRHVMAEGEEVMAEVETTGLRRDGRKYHNRYAQIFVVR